MQKSLIIVTMSLSLVAQEIPLLQPKQWQPNNDGGNPPKYEVVNDGYARFTFDTVNGKFGWGNFKCTPFSLPPKASAITFDLYVEEAKDNAAMHLWLGEADGDAWCARIQPSDGHSLAAVKNTWRSVEVPFTSFNYQPRGDKQRNFMSVNYLLIGCNFGNHTVRIRNLNFKSTAIASVPLAPVLPASWTHEDPVGKRIAILAEPSFPKLPGHADAARLAKLLQSAGYHPQLVTAGDLSSPVFSKKSIDLLILPNAPFFPVPAIDNFRKFLQDNGCFISIGGYPLDKTLYYTADGWQEHDNLTTADQISDNTVQDTQLNTRYGKHGDTMQLKPTQIGVCDPSFLLLRTASARPAPAQDWFTGDWTYTGRLEGPAAIAMTGSNSPVFPTVHGRYIPLIQTLDSLGRNRGPAAAAVLNHGGPYKDANWAFFTATNHDFFNGSQPELDKLFINVCKRLLSPLYLVKAWCDRPCARPGETVKLQARLHPQDALEQSALTIRFLIDGKPVGEASKLLEQSWTLPAQDSMSFHAFTVELLQNGKRIDHLDSGLAVWNAASLQQGISLKLQDNYFNLNGQPTFFIGANTTGMMWFSDNENPLVWKKDFSAMRDYGLNFMRILHFSPFSKDPVDFKWSSQALLTQPEKTKSQTDAIVQLAQENQIAVFLSLHDWIPLDLSQMDLDAQKAWNAFWVARYKDVPGMFYDIQNEPSTTLNNTNTLLPLFKEFLAVRHGSVEAARAAWKASGASDEINLNNAASSWQDLHSRDVEQFRAYVFSRWVENNQEAIKAANPQALATVGHLQTLTASDKFDGADSQDFVNVHHYGDLTNMRSVIKMIDRRFDGKSISLGEMGSAIAHNARTAGQWGDTAEASIRHYLSVGHCSLGMGVSFMGCWSWKDFQDCVFPWGINHADLTAKPVLECFRNMSLLFRNLQPRYVSPELFIVIPDGFRFGPNMNQIHENLRIAIDMLLTLNVPFGVINEWAIDRLPSSANALIWPLAYGAKDETFDKIQSFVAHGGRLLLTGDPRFGYSRQPDRLDRLSKLGIKTDLAPLAFNIGTDWQQEVSTANVLWQPAPAEFKDYSKLRQLYQQFLDGIAQAKRLHLSIDDGSLLAFDVPAHNGHAFCMVNFSNNAQTVTVPAHGDIPEITLGIAPFRTSYLQWNAQKQLVAFNVQGQLRIGGELVVRDGKDCGIVALDKQDVRASSQLAALPFLSDVIPQLERLPQAPDLAITEIGEFRQAQWTPLSRTTNADTPYDIRLLTTNQQYPSAVKAMETLLKR